MNLINSLFAMIYIGIITEVVIRISIGVEKSIKLLINGAMIKAVTAPKIL